MRGEAGRRGSDVRSDCWVRVEPGGEGLRLSVTSKVEAMYGPAIRKQITDDMTRMGATDAEVTVEDGGALPFTLSARLEAAVRRAGVDPRAPALPPRVDTRPANPRRDRPRRSRLYLPGNEPKFMVNAGLHGADTVILDLEDSVAPREKDAARVLVRNALLGVDFGESERMVRINQLPLGLEDLRWVVPYGVEVILIPKCESADQVHEVVSTSQEIAPRARILIMPIIESAMGCFRALEIATASGRVCALAIGLEDYAADIGALKTNEGRESVWARSVVVNAARAAGVQPIDSVFADVVDMEALRQNVLEAKALGFEGKGCIHPRQIPVIHEAFAPEDEEIEWAKKIVRAFEEAKAKGLSVVSVGSKMVDPPVVKRAEVTLERARLSGRLPEDTSEEGDG